VYPKSVVTPARFSRRSVALVVSGIVAACALALSGVAGQTFADTAPVAGAPATVSADALPTVQINGVVWSQVVVGNTVYATGSFTQARPAGVAVGGAGTVTRSNLLAYNITTGVLLTTFNHSLNGQGYAITKSPDGSVIYVGGVFTAVDGQAHSRLAAFNTATGALISSFAPSFNNSVRAVTASATAVYAGGDFTSIGSSSRNHVASLTTAGAVVGSFNPGANLAVDSLALTPDKTRLIVGGRFAVLGGATAIGMGSVNSTTGAAEPWAANTVIKDQGSGSAIYSLSSDATQVYGTGYFYTTGGNFEGRFAANPNTGAIVWMNNCHGDSYSSWPNGAGVLYSVGHAHDCNDIGGFVQDDAVILNSTAHRALAEATAPSGAVERHALFISGPNSPTYHDFFGEPVTTQLDWYPTLLTGTFTGQGQAAWSVSGNSQYVVLGGEFPIVNNVAQQGLTRFAVSSVAPNRVGPASASTLTPLVSSQSSGTARVAWQTDWDQDNTTLSYSVYRDGGTTPVYTTTYNSLFYQRASIGFVDRGLTPGSTHTYKVVARDPFGNSRTSGTTTATIGSSSPSSYANRVVGDGAIHFWPLSEGSGTVLADRAGFSDSLIQGAVTLGASGPVSGSGTGATFKGGENTPSGGQPGPNSSVGTIGTQPALGAFSIEAWFKTTSGSGGGLVDQGLYQAKDSATIDKTLYLDPSGRVHFGVQNNLNRQAINGGSAYNNGVWHHAVGTFNGSTLVLYVDGVAVASRGAVTDNIAYPGYWRIGGDNLAGWPSRSGNYIAGSIADVAVYPTALASGTVSAHFQARNGGAVATNTPPVASFTSSCSVMTCSVNGSGSTDANGSIVSYSWNYGDGKTASGVTASHTYTTAGTYSVTLSVTDNGGATSSTAKSLVASAPAPAGPAVIASDTFARTVAAGFGTAAPSGGAWTSAKTASDLAVSPGAAKITAAGGIHSGAYLGSVATTRTNVLTTLAVNKLPLSGNGYFLWIYGRQISANDSYQTRVRIAPGGVSKIAIGKFNASTTETTLTSELTGPTVRVGGKLDIRTQITGTNPTTIRSRVWLDGTTEPTTWTLSATDTSAALQRAGRVGVEGYLSGSTTNGPIVGTLSKFLVTAVD
jgi:PKD repeat protein